MKKCFDTFKFNEHSLCNIVVAHQPKIMFKKNIKNVDEESTLSVHDLLQLALLTFKKFHSQSDFYSESVITEKSSSSTGMLGLPPSAATSW